MRPIGRRCFLHRPLARVRPDDPKHKGRYVGEAARDRLLDGPLKATLRLVNSGHTHQYLDALVGGVRHVWMPSSAFVLPDSMQARIGEKLVGIGLLVLEQETMQVDLWVPTVWPATGCQLCRCWRRWPTATRTSDRSSSGT